jgi:hypothetical protein
MFEDFQEYKYTFAAGKHNKNWVAKKATSYIENVTKSVIAWISSKEKGPLVPLSP